MKIDEMKAELTKSLEFWNKALIQEGETQLRIMITERMKGMIEIAKDMEIISQAEKDELLYIYFSDNIELNEIATPGTSVHNARGAGRKKTVDVKLIHDFRDQGKTQEWTAKEMNVSISTIRRNWNK